MEPEVQEMLKDTGWMKLEPTRSLLRRALRREDWELASYCLIIGLMEAQKWLPPGDAEELLDLLSAADSQRERERQAKRGNRAGRG